VLRCSGSLRTDGIQHVSKSNTRNIHCIAVRMPQHEKHFAWTCNSFWHSSPVLNSQCLCVSVVNDPRNNKKRRSQGPALSNFIPLTLLRFPLTSPRLPFLSERRSTVSPVRDRSPGSCPPRECECAFPEIPRSAPPSVRDRL